MSIQNNKVNTAVILAAGMGTRLREVVGGKPKGLLEINGNEIMKQSLDRILKNGIEKIIMVTGYESDVYQETLKEQYPMIEYVQNPDYARTGSMHSLYLAKEKIEGNFLLFESDLLYENRCISVLLELEQEDAILLSGATQSGDEVYIYGQNGLIELITKEAREELNKQGELVGISKISLPLYDKMCNYYHKEIVFPSDFHYEDCLSGLAASIDVKYHLVEDIIWTEIDDPSHYERALKLILPRILEKEC